MGSIYIYIYDDIYDDDDGVYICIINIRLNI